MRNFKTWLEDLNQIEEKPPNPKFQRFWVNDPKNPEQIAAWQRSETVRTHEFPLAKDKFVHFSLIESIPEILKSGLIVGESVFGISLSFGKWFPIVQYNHIINKKKEKLINIKHLKSKRYTDRLLQNGYKVPNFGEEIGAVVFRTNQKPHMAHAEEVIWNGPLQIINAKSVSSREAINMLKHTPYNIGEDDIVKYK